jgi:copper resistance protein D
VTRYAEESPGITRLLRFSSAGLIVSQLSYLLLSSAILQSTTGLPWADVIGASAYIWSVLSVVAAIAILFLLARRSSSRLLDTGCALCILAANTATSHAAARVNGQALLLGATAFHQGAAAIWIGGLPYLLLQMRASRTDGDTLTVARRFSRVAVAAVIALVVAGVVLSVVYIGAPQAVYGTTYGVMTVSKILLFLFALLLGGLNYRALRSPSPESFPFLRTIRRFSEMEIGIGITAILAAASLTSQPPGADLVHDRVPLKAIAERMAPKIPRMQTPPLETLSPSSREAWKKNHRATGAQLEAYTPGQQAWTAPTQGDIAWSEYNHHWAGLVVLLMGVLAVLSRFRGFRWARHWPLAFFGLAVFLLIRADPENWPLGPSGFWESFTSADVTQHRIFVVLIVLFAIFEWRVQTGRPSAKTALVFPAICALGGAALLTHTHALTNVREELLAELSHVPLALLAVAAGWCRWLEVRGSGTPQLVASRVWPVCFALIGVVLLAYREA